MNSPVDDEAEPGLVVGSTPAGRFALPSKQPDRLLFCDNETNFARLFGQRDAGYYKDGFHDFVVHGRAMAVNSPAWHQVRRHSDRTVPPAGSVVRVRLCAGASERRASPTSTHMFAQRRRGGCVLRGPAGRHHRRGHAARAAPGLCRNAVEQAVLPLRRRALAGRRSAAAAAAREPQTWAQQRVGVTSTPPTSSRCRTNGNTPGSPPGTSPSIASRSL